MTKNPLPRVLRPTLGAILALALLPAAASAAPATDKTWTDVPETKAPAADIVSVRRVAAPADGRWLRVVVRLGEPIEAGDNLEVHFDTDGDPAPEVWVAGAASSEFEVFDTDHWRDNDDPVGADCARMRFALGERRGVVRFDPQCIDDDPVRAVRVNVQTYLRFTKAVGRDFAPARKSWLSRVAAKAPAVR